MLNVFRRPQGLLLCLSLFAAAAPPVARAQAQTATTPLERQLQHIDLGVSAVYVRTGDVSGPVIVNSSNKGSVLQLSPSNTVGVLATLRYTIKPYLGFEGNFGYQRYTENVATTSNSSAPINFGIQTNVSEYTLGYVAHSTQRPFGLKPFVSAGLGSIAFRPTPNGGLGLPVQARAAYYYAAGVENQIFDSHFGIRAQFRQVFFLAPDYGQNYLTIKQRTSTLEPGVGFYVHF